MSRNLHILPQIFKNVFFLFLCCRNVSFESVLDVPICTSIFQCSNPICSFLRKQALQKLSENPPKACSPKALRKALWKQALWMTFVERSPKVRWISSKALGKPFKRRVNCDNTLFRDTIAWIGGPSFRRRLWPVGQLLAPCGVIRRHDLRILFTIFYNFDIFGLFWHFLTICTNLFFEFFSSVLTMLNQLTFVHIFMNCGAYSCIEETVINIVVFSISSDCRSRRYILCFFPTISDCSETFLTWLWCVEQRLQ